jgi:hypothetical protein
MLKPLYFLSITGITHFQLVDLFPVQVAYYELAMVIMIM